MNTKTIAVGALLLVLVLGGGFFLMQSQAKPENSNRTPDTATTPSVSDGINEPMTFSLNEVAKHASEADCWMAIEGKVYNATAYISKHIGGKAILNGCGKDATTLFNERPSDNKGPHPVQAKTELDALYIGDLSTE